MKNINQLKQQMRKLQKNNKGIETRVLIYILAAIALIAAIGIVTQVNNQASTMTEKALTKAQASVPGGAMTQAECDSLYPTPASCSVTDCNAACCTAGTVTNGKLDSCTKKTGLPTK